jgi:hypothetical protein
MIEKILLNKLKKNILPNKLNLLKETLKQFRKKAPNKNNKNNKNNKSNKKTKKNKGNNVTNQKGGTKDKFEVTTLQNFDQRKIDSLKLSNYVNDNIDWGIMPGPPPTDCVIM